METKYQFTEEMREISGFGGYYEQTCRDMLKAGLEWLDNNPQANPQYHGYKGICGIIKEDNEDAKLLTKAVVDAVYGDCTGAMHQAVISHCLWIKSNGWDNYVMKMEKREMKMETTKPARQVKTSETVQYIRDHKRNPIGVMVAIPVNGKLAIGYSLCCKKDKFNKECGKRLARIRANLFINAHSYLINKFTNSDRITDIKLREKRTETVIIPHTVYCSLLPFINKCRYKYNNNYSFASWILKII